MKISDDYQAKVRLWAMRPAVVALARGASMPKFTARKFRTHEELNQWKQSRLLELARAVASHG